MKLIKNLCWLVLTLVICAAFSTTGMSTVHAAAIPHVQTSPISQHSTGEPNWAQQGDPYVHITNYRALVDPTISQHLDVNEVKIVQTATNRYNNLPLTIRQKGTISGRVNLISNHNANLRPAACCDYQWTLNWYWWGARIWISNYAAQNFGIAIAVIGAGIGAAVGAGIGAVPGAVIGAIIGAVSGGAAAFVNNECGDRGIFIDINWGLQVSLVPVC